MSTSETLLLSTHLGATFAMVGLIWFVQVVHYPLFDGVGPEHFVDYAVAHQRRTSWVVGLPMALEGVTTLMLLVAAPDGVGPVLPLVGIGLLAVIHASTVLLQVPAHAALAQSYDADLVRHLVRTNWIRTLGWSARGGIAVALLADSMS